MKTRTFLLFSTLSLLATRAASAQEMCPVATVGTICDQDSGATCLSAKCTDTEPDGSVTVSVCAACVILPPNNCPVEDNGQPCGDAGGVCALFGGGTGNGTADGGSSELSYDWGECVVVGDGGGGDYPDGASLNAGDAAPTTGSGTAVDAAPATDAAPTEGVLVDSVATGPQASSGCSIPSTSGARVGGGLWLSVMGAALLLARRRRDRSA